MLWLSATYPSSSQQGTWLPVTYRLATRTCAGSKNPRLLASFVARSKKRSLKRRIEVQIKGATPKGHALIAATSLAAVWRQSCWAFLDVVLIVSVAILLTGILGHLHKLSFAASPHCHAGLHGCCDC